MTTWQPRLSSTQSTSTRTRECMVLRLSEHRHIAHWLHRMAQVRAVSVIHPIHMRSWCVRFSLAINLSILFILYLSQVPVAILPLPHLEARRVPVHFAQKGKGLHWRDLLPHKWRAQTPTTSRRLRSSPPQSSWPRRRSSPNKGFPMTPSSICAIIITFKIPGEGPTVM